MSDRLQLIVCATTALALVAATGWRASAADDAADRAAALAADGQFVEAYQRLQHEGRAEDPAALATVAGALLSRAIRSDDAFERWAGLRAGRTLHAPALTAAARDQLQRDSRYEQALALEILINADPMGSRAEFVAALDSPYRSLRLRALRGLQKHRDDPALVPALIIAATEDRDPDVRVLALRTLRQWQAPDAAPSLRRALDDPSPAVQIEAVRTLVALGDAEVAEIVRRRVVDGPSEQRIAALRLAALVPQRQLTLAIAPLLADPDAELRAAAAGAILSIAEQAGKDGP